VPKVCPERAVSYLRPPSASQRDIAREFSATNVQVKKQEPHTRRREALFQSCRRRNRPYLVPCAFPAFMAAFRQLRATQCGSGREHRTTLEVSSQTKKYRNCIGLKVSRFNIDSTNLTVLMPPVEFPSDLGIESQGWREEVISSDPKLQGKCVLNFNLSLGGEAGVLIKEIDVHTDANRIIVNKRPMGHAKLTKREEGNSIDEPFIDTRASSPVNLPLNVEPKRDRVA